MPRHCLGPSSPECAGSGVARIFFAASRPARSAHWILDGVVLLLPLLLPLLLLLLLLLMLLGGYMLSRAATGDAATHSFSVVVIRRSKTYSIRF